MKAWLLPLFAAMWLLVPPGAAGEPRLGGAAVAIPAPKGLITLANHASPYFKFMAQVQEQGNGRLVEAFLPRLAALRADSGLQHDSDEWAIAFALVRNESQTITATMFERQFIPVWEQSIEQVLADPAMRRKVDGIMDGSVDPLKREPGAATEMSLETGVITPLGIYAKNPRYVSNGAATKLKMTHPGGVSQEIPIVMVLTILNINERLLGTGFYRKLRTREDIDIAKAKALEWADALVKANR